MGKNCEHYERYNFNATEEDYVVCNILLGLQSLIHKSDPSPLTWATKRKRSVLNSTPTATSPEPEPVPITQQEKKKQEERLHSPSSPLGYSPNHSKRKSKKKKLKDWEEHVEKLKENKQQLILTLDNVKKYQRAVLAFNMKLKAKRDELNGHIPKQSNAVETHPQFPIFTRHQQQQYSIQPSMTLYYPTPFFPMRIIDGYSDKALRAADARKRRRLQINQKKNSIGIRRFT